MVGREKKAKLKVRLPRLPPMTFLKVRSKEWNAAWKALAEATGDVDRTALNQRSGEAWQYMGSEKRLRGWEHSFRHRDHPSTNERVYVWVRATGGWLPDKSLRM